MSATILPLPHLPLITSKSGDGSIFCNEIDAKSHDFGRRRASDFLFVVRVTVPEEDPEGA